MAEQQLKRLHRNIVQCRRCLNAGFDVVLRPIFSGVASAAIMLVGQAPGNSETRTGRPFDGPAGKRLFRWLERAGFDEQAFRNNQYITAITKCFPGKKAKGSGDRVPTTAERKLCAPFLDRELKIIRPTLIIPVGRVAISRFVSDAPLSDIVGKLCKQKNHYVLPLPHPSGANRWLIHPQHKELLGKALEQLSLFRVRQ